MDVSPVKSGRRVLGDLKVNATFGIPNSPSRVGKTVVKTTTAATAIHIDDGEGEENTLQLLLSPAKIVTAGRKRSISEVVSDDSTSQEEEDHHHRRRKEEERERVSESEMEEDRDSDSRMSRKVQVRGNAQFVVSSTSSEQ